LEIIIGKGLKSKSMQKPGHYNNIIAFIEALNNAKIPYIVIRNYDNLLEDALYMEGHGDIDLLCANSIELAKKIHAFPQEFHIKNGVEDGVHYYVFINGAYCSLDLRYLGDGYYCEKWEEDLLKNREKHNGFYVPSSTDYFYSLIYHAIFQKNKFSKEYQERLEKMAKDLHIKLQGNTLSDFVHLLEKHMEERGYTYVYPKDKYVPFKKKYIQNENLLVVDKQLKRQHFAFHTKVACIEFLVKIKHRLFGKK